MCRKLLKYMYSITHRLWRHAGKRLEVTWYLLLGRPGRHPNLHGSAPRWGFCASFTLSVDCYRASNGREDATCGIHGLRTQHACVAWPSARSLCIHI